MIKNPRLRRAVSIVLLIIGGVLIFFAPGNAWLGLALLAAGLLLEVLSLDLRHGGKSGTK